MRQVNKQGASMNRANRRSISSHGGRNGWQPNNYGNEHNHRSANYGQDEYTTNEQDNDYIHTQAYDRYNESDHDRDEQELPGTYPDETERVTGGRNSRQYRQHNEHQNGYNNYSDEPNRGYNYDDYDEREQRNSTSYGGSLGRNDYRQDTYGNPYGNGYNDRNQGWEPNGNDDYNRNRNNTGQWGQSGQGNTNEWSDRYRADYGREQYGRDQYNRHNNSNNNYRGSRYASPRPSGQHASGNNAHNYRNSDNSYRGYDDDYNSGRQQSNRVRSYGDANHGNGNYGSRSDYGRMPYEQEDDYRHSARNGFGSQSRGENTQIARNGRNGNSGRQNNNR